MVIIATILLVYGQRMWPERWKMIAEERAKDRDVTRYPEYDPRHGKRLLKDE